MFPFSTQISDYHTFWGRMCPDVPVEAKWESRWLSQFSIRRGVNRFADRRIWPQKAQGLRTSAIIWADSQISKIQRIADQLRILTRIPDFDCLNVRIMDPKRGLIQRQLPFGFWKRLLNLRLLRSFLKGVHEPVRLLQFIPHIIPFRYKFSQIMLSSVHRCHFPVTMFFRLQRYVVSGGIAPGIALQNREVFSYLHIKN